MNNHPSKHSTYDEYEPVDHPWIDSKPKKWGLTKLKYTSTINMGQSPNSDECNNEGNGLPFLQGNAEFGTFSPTPKLFCDSAKKVCQPDDILLSVRAPVGELNIANQQFGIGRGLCAITPLSIAPKFAWWLLKASVEQLQSVATGSTFKAVSAEQVSNLVCLHPQLTEQTQIAAFLDRETAKIDQLIDKQQQLIKLLEEKRQAFISHAVTKGLNPDASMIDSGVEWLGEVPAHWDIAPLKYHIKTSKGVAFKSSDFIDEGVGVVKASDIKQGSIRSISTYLPNSYIHAHSSALLKAGDIILSTVGSTPDVTNSAVGQIGEVTPEFDGTLLNQNTVIFKPATRLNNQFLKLFLFSTAYRKHLDLHAHGTANQASLSLEDMLSFCIALPPANEQTQIIINTNKTLDLIDSLMRASQKSIQLSLEKRQALISAAVTGKIDVRHPASHPSGEHSSSKSAIHADL